MLKEVINRFYKTSGQLEAYTIEGDDGSVIRTTEDFYSAVVLATQQESARPTVKSVNPPFTQRIANTTATFHASNPLEKKKITQLDGEQKVLEKFLENLQTRDVVYDIGANLGLYTCFAKSKATNGKIIAIEPHGASLDRLRENLELNSGGTVLSSQLALGAEKDQLEVAIPEGTSVGGGAISLAERGSGETVPVLPLDDFISEYDVPQPTVLKIDVEGFELDVLKGAEETLQNPDLNHVFCEVHPDEAVPHAEGLSMEEIDELESLLQNKGFVVEELSERGAQQFIHASRQKTS